ncbi:MAG TPA: hypothetical protein VGK54_17030 [Chloroflexota bacterium]
MKAIIQIPIDRELLTRIDGQAKREATSRAAVIRSACALYLRQVESRERDRLYIEGYERIPEQVSEPESLAWLTAADLPSEEWPEAPGAKR